MIETPRRKQVSETQPTKTNNVGTIVRTRHPSCNTRMDLRHELQNRKEVAAATTTEEGDSTSAFCQEGREKRCGDETSPESISVPDVCIDPPIPTKASKVQITILSGFKYVVAAAHRCPSVHRELWHHRFARKKSWETRTCAQDRSHSEMPEDEQDGVSTERVPACVNNTRRLTTLKGRTRMAIERDGSKTGRTP